MTEKILGEDIGISDGRGVKQHDKTNRNRRRRNSGKDGTMTINPEYMTVIRKLTEMGITFVVCSGRQYDSERKLFEPLKDLVYFVSDGGTVIRKNDKILKVHTLPDETWKRASHGKRKMPECDCFIATPECCYAENENGRMFRWLRDSYGYDMRKVDDLSSLEENRC